jgi:hypothetical protein
MYLKVSRFCHFYHFYHNYGHCLDQLLTFKVQTAPLDVAIYCLDGVAHPKLLLTLLDEQLQALPEPLKLKAAVQMLSYFPGVKVSNCDMWLSALYTDTFLPDVVSSLARCTHSAMDSTSFIDGHCT